MITTSKEQQVTELVARPEDQPVRKVLSEDLFQGQKIIIIKHSGCSYELRITKNEKLILTK